MYNFLGFGPQGYVAFQAYLLTDYETAMSSSYRFCFNASPQVMHCSNLTSLPTLPLPGQQTTTEAVVQELLVEESNIHTLWMKKLYNENNLISLRRLDLVDCGIQTIQEEAFYQMSRLQNLNIRCLLFFIGSVLNSKAAICEFHFFSVTIFSHDWKVTNSPTCPD